MEDVLTVRLRNQSLSHASVRMAGKGLSVTCLTAQIIATTGESVSSPQEESISATVT